MTPIKFRGQRKDNKEWVYGDLIHNAFNGTKIVDIGIKEDGCYPIEVIPETVGQYTGLNDKNGKEIYFGDKCKYKDEAGNEQIGIVKDYGYFSAYIEAIGGDDEGNQDIQLHTDYMKKVEVIGNIHEEEK